MTVIINGTNGITSVNGTAAAPSVTGTDTDTGIVYGTNTLSLATGGTTALTANSSQGIQVLNTIGVGNTTPSTSGAGISFPASQSASTDANTLDDYEEGTWTPAFAFGGGTTGITYAWQVGRYTRVGRVVTLQCYCNVSNKGSSSGAVTLTGFPFNSSSGSNNYCAVSIWGNSMTGLSGSQMAYIPPGQSFMYMYYSATGSVTAINNTNFGNNTDWMINVTYEVA